ncbi:MAG: L-2-hydroxyglutarate oxidase [Leptospiraceae bacterium]|nr:L-2-hydroxyglutarate oxidase [Leptospiraceae bacterium]MCP5498972.1 L-2-hydroxyglutarate oxidase [Leptospiraceae bacterium]
MSNWDCVIIGAGIVGLGTAYALKKRKPNWKIIILEKEDSICKHQSGHNSGVIHSGIYYKPGSLKADNCKSGYKLLLDFCKQHAIKHEICGKIIVANSEEEIVSLHKIQERGIANGLDGLRYLSEEEIQEREPCVRAKKALLVPQAGIVHYPEVGQKLAELLLKEGVEFAYSEEVKSVRQKNGLEVVGSKHIYTTKKLISCAGLYSDKILSNIHKNSAMIIPFRGEYFTLKEDKRSLVQHLIYPVPDPRFPFLGVHFTRRINGEIEAGPNAVLAFRREGYTKKDISVREFSEILFFPGFYKMAAKYWKTGMGEMWRSFSKASFTRALQTLVPAIQESDLVKGGSGVRAQAVDREGNLLDDFSFQQVAEGFFLLNAPSPAATSSLSIGEMICDKILSNHTV